MIINPSDKILICFGTRPEYIKVKSLINNLPNNVKTCFTGQHTDLLKDVLVDYKLDMNENISENRLNNIICNVLKYIYIFENIDYVLVQGDTTTALAIAISAFNNGKKIIHLEAGLRSNDITDPYPEEANRQIISRIANIHLCPTEFNKQNLLNEQTKGTIHVIGNTGLDNISKEGCIYDSRVLITLHRRDNHEIMDKWFIELEKIANKYTDIEFLIPLHPNPNVQKYRHIFEKVKVVEPMSHDNLIDYLKKCKFVISDSGGLQEECSYLNKKIIVCRKTTERPESVGIHSFMCESPDKLSKLVDEINIDFSIDEECPYGNGESWKNIKISNNGCLLFCGHEGSSAINSYLSQSIYIFGFEFFEENNFDNFTQDTIFELLETLYTKNKHKFSEKLNEYKFNLKINIDDIFPKSIFFFKIRYQYINDNIVNLFKKFNVTIFSLKRNDKLRKAISIYDGQLQFKNIVITEPKYYNIDKIKEILININNEDNLNNSIIDIINKQYSTELIYYEDLINDKYIFLRNIMEKLNLDFINLDVETCFFKKVHDNNLENYVLNLNELLTLDTFY